MLPTTTTIATTTLARTTTSAMSTAPATSSMSTATTAITKTTRTHHAGEEGSRRRETWKRGALGSNKVWFLKKMWFSK